VVAIAIVASGSPGQRWQRRRPGPSDPATDERFAVLSALPILAGVPPSALAAVAARLIPIPVTAARS